MKICCKISTLLLLCCCWCMLLASPANSKVCFAGDPGCGGIDSFGSYQDPDEKIANQCAAAGYSTRREECTLTEGMQVTDSCPYDSNYVTCCTMDYQYDSCPKPLIEVGRCGKKYKCACDKSIYPYSQSGGNKCQDNARVGGASCAQVSYSLGVNGQGSISTDLFFSDCVCDTGLYPYEESQCALETAKGTMCKSRDNKGAVQETRYAACYCDTSVYPETERSCYPITPNLLAGSCKSGDTTRYKSCNSCNGYPADSLDHVAYSSSQTPQRCSYNEETGKYYKKLYLEHGSGKLGKYIQTEVDVSECDYLECPYVQESGHGPYKILQCHEPGYEVNSDGSACKLISCEKAVKAFIQKNPSYSWFNPGTHQTEDYQGNKVKTTMAIMTAGIPPKADSCQSETVTTYTCKTWKCVTLGIGSTCYNSKLTSTAGKPSCEEKQTPTCSTEEYVCGSKCCKLYDRNDELCAPGQNYNLVTEKCESLRIDQIFLDTNIDYDKLTLRTMAVGDNTGLVKTDPTTPGGTLPDIREDIKYACCTDYNIKASLSYGPGLGCSAATKYYSVPYLLKDLNTSDDTGKALSKACANNTPTFPLTSGQFPSSHNTSTRLEFYGVNLSFTGNTDINSPLVVTNGNVTATGGTLYIKQSLALTADKTRPNYLPTFKANNVSVEVASARAMLMSFDYNFDISGDLRFKFTKADYSAVYPAAFYLRENGVFRAKKVLLYPSSRKKVEDDYVDYNSSIAFVGPESGATANAYGSVVLGYGYGDTYYKAHNMSIGMSGNLVWNLYDGSTKYDITLSPGSKIYANNTGSSYQAYIKRDTNPKNIWSKCAMKEKQQNYVYSKYCQGGTCTDEKYHHYTCMGDCNWGSKRGRTGTEYSNNAPYDGELSNNWSLICNVNTSGTYSYVQGTPDHAWPDPDDNYSYRNHKASAKDDERHPSCGCGAPSTHMPEYGASYGCTIKWGSGLSWSPISCE